VKRAFSASSPAAGCHLPLLISLSGAQLDHGRSFRLGRRLAFDRARAGILAARAIDCGDATLNKARAGFCALVKKMGG
jgi:hypothetical protein